MPPLSIRHHSPAIPEMAGQGQRESAKAEESEAVIFQTVLFYSLNILLTPLVTFLVCKLFLLEGLLGLESSTSNIWSAILAIIVLHLMLGLYLYRTFYPASKSTKQD